MGCHLLSFEKRTTAWVKRKVVSSARYFLKFFCQAKLYSLVGMELNKLNSALFVREQLAKIYYKETKWRHYIWEDMFVWVWCSICSLHLDRIINRWINDLIFSEFLLLIKIIMSDELFLKCGNTAIQCSYHFIPLHSQQ